MRSYRSAMREKRRRTYRLLLDGVESACLSEMAVLSFHFRLRFSAACGAVTSIVPFIIAA